MPMCGPAENYEKTALCYQDSEGNYNLVPTEWQRNIQLGYF